MNKCGLGIINHFIDEDDSIEAQYCFPIKILAATQKSIRLQWKIVKRVKNKWGEKGPCV